LISDGRPGCFIPVDLTRLVLFYSRCFGIAPTARPELPSGQYGHEDRFEACRYAAMYKPIICIWLAIGNISILSPRLRKDQRGAARYDFRGNVRCGGETRLAGSGEMLDGGGRPLIRCGGN